MPDTTTNFELFQDLEKMFDGGEPCDLHECENQAKWLVVCPECHSSEAVCNPHCIELKHQIETVQFNFTFDHSCGHVVPADQCPFVPMG